MYTLPTNENDKVYSTNLTINNSFTFIELESMRIRVGP